MTREEAEYFLRGISYKLGNIAVEYLSEKDGEKMREAIKALEQEPTTKNNLGVDCISRQEVIDLLMQKWGENFSGDDAIQESIDAIRVMPSVTPQEPKTGHWKPYLKEGLRYQCSACDSRFDTPWEYCPHCGAKMAESEDKDGQTNN